MKKGIKVHILIKILLVFVFCPILVFTQNKDENIVIGKTQKIFSKVLSEDRTLQISLPSDYESGNNLYPVVFVLDGNTNFNFTADIANYLSEYNLIPKTIVVGIPNTNRNRDFLPSLNSSKQDNNNNRQGVQQERRSGKADNFVDFLKQEAIPYIDKNYRTLSYKVLIGHSLGGLFVIHQMIKEPDLFSGNISISPSLWWNNQEYIKKPQEFFKNQKSLNKTLFVTLANESEDEPEFYKRMKTAFEKNTPKDFISEVKIYPDKNHITTAVEATLDGLVKIFSTWMPARELIFSGDLDAIKKFYKQQGEKLGFIFLPPESIINEMAYNKLRKNELQKSIDLFKYNVEHYPNSANVYDSLAEAYVKAGNKELAIENYEKSLKINPNNQKGIEALKQLRETK